MILKVKKLFIFFILFIVFTFLMYGIFLSRYTPNVFSNGLVFNNAPGYYDYSGAINVRTLQTSGSGTIQEISEAARASGLDFVILTDLNTLPEARDAEGNMNNVLILIGSEYKYLDSRLLNINGSLQDFVQNSGRSQIYLTDLLNDESRSDSNGFFALAHPLKPGYQWSGDVPVGLEAIEVFNLKAIWQWAWLKDRSSFAWTLLTYPFNPNLAFARLFAESSDDELLLWDQLNKERKVVGLAGSAAESRVKFFGQVLQVPSYQTLFNIMKNHVLLTSELTGNFEIDKKKIYSALKLGQSYLSLDLLSNPKGFVSYMRSENDKIYNLGSEITSTKNLDLIVRLPSKPQVPFQVMIYRNGEKILSSTSVETSLPIRENGSYRVVVRLRVLLPIPDGKIWIPWIFTNPIHVKSFR